MNDSTPLAPYLRRSGLVCFLLLLPLLTDLRLFAMPPNIVLRSSQGKPMQTIYSDHRALAHALALIESGDDPKAKGDLNHPDGPALGAFQIHQSAWMDISDIRRSEGLPVHPYHDAYDPHVAREYATTFLLKIVSRFRVHHRAPPSPALLYACYSLGPSVLNKIGHMTDLKHVISPYEPSIVCAYSDKAPWKPLTSIGYSYALARRKMATGMRYENLLYAHHESLRSTGLPLLWL